MRAEKLRCEVVRLLRVCPRGARSLGSNAGAAQSWPHYVVTQIWISELQRHTAVFDGHAGCRLTNNYLTRSNLEADSHDFLCRFGTLSTWRHQLLFSMKQSAAWARVSGGCGNFPK